MTRLRRRASILVLAVMALGIGAGSAFASEGCCAEMAAAHAGGEREAPCHSVAPTSCCEPSAPGAFPSLPGAPLLAVAVELRAPEQSALAEAIGVDPSARARAALATTVLRL